MDFALILFVLSIVTGVLWFYDVFKARKQRAKGTPDPWWVEYGASFFTVILPIFWRPVFGVGSVMLRRRCADERSCASR